jgi:acyl carrier protein
MRLLRNNIYEYLGDDMIKVTSDMTFFGDLQMNHVDWYNVLYPAEVELNMRLDPAKSPSPEAITLGEIADFVEKHR